MANKVKHGSDSGKPQIERSTDADRTLANEARKPRSMRRYSALAKRRRLENSRPKRNQLTLRG